LKPREPHHGTRSEEKDEDPVEPVLTKHGEVHDHRRSKPKRDGINQRVEFLAELASGVRRPRHAAVDCVGHGAPDDVPHRAGKIAPRRRHDGEHAKEQIQQSESVRQHHH
jgi:hypothetical protein